MALVGRHERMSAQRALQLGMVSQVVDPPERCREEAQALAEKIARQLAGGHGGHQAGAVGRPGAGLTDACRAGAGLVSMWGHPDQAEGPGLRREARAAWMAIELERNNEHCGAAIMSSTSSTR